MGQVFLAGKNLLIDRKNRKNAIDALNSVGDRMKKENLSIFMFPEGTRSRQRDNTLLPFKKGAFHIAKNGKFPIVPIVSSTYYPLYDEKDKVFERGTIQVKGTCSLYSLASDPH
jgi:1-acyl-sn-glycerol-3-phosphate acyltransferase